jgi:hypothetical protein
MAAPSSVRERLQDMLAISRGRTTRAERRAAGGEGKARFRPRGSIRQRLMRFASRLTRSPDRRLPRGSLLRWAGRWALQSRDGFAPGDLHANLGASPTLPRCQDPDAAGEPDDQAPSGLKPTDERSQLVDRLGKILHPQRRDVRHVSESKTRDGLRLIPREGIATELGCARARQS